MIWVRHFRKRVAHPRDDSLGSVSRTEQTEVNQGQREEDYGIW